AIAGVAEPVARLKSAFLDTGAAMRQQSAATLVAFRADMRRMVAERALSLREALVLDVDYTARLGDQELVQYQRLLRNDAATVDERESNYAKLVKLSERYQAQIAQGERRVAEAARREADRLS